MTKPEEARSALRVSVGVSVAPRGRVQLYCSPATSEVSGEYLTLHEALSAAMPNVGARLICQGTILASVPTIVGGEAFGNAGRRWLFEQAGIECLITEFNVINSSPGL